MLQSDLLPAPPDADSAPVQEAPQEPAGGSITRSPAPSPSPLPFVAPGPDWTPPRTHTPMTDTFNRSSLLNGSRREGSRQIGPETVRRTVSAVGGRAPGPNRATESAIKIRHEIMRVFAGDLPLAHASPRVRRYMQVLDSVGKKAIKGKALREFREMNAEVFKLLPREDTLIHRAETIFVGAGADEAADEALRDGEEVPHG